MQMVFRKAGLEDAEMIYGIMMEIEKHMSAQDHFVGSDIDSISSHIEGVGVTYLAQEDDVVMGFIILEFPGSNSNNLGLDIGLPESELRKVVHMDTIVVLPAYRGRGLQKAMLAYAEQQAQENGYTELLATVHPDNVASLKNFLACGYTIQDTKVKYGGVLRHILYKRCI